ncbi:MAG: Crp/Fnr family transcriptional regulator [Bacillus sp. (in: firmicutes)]
MNTQAISNLLSTFALFQELDRSELAEIIEIGIVRAFKKGSHIFLQDEPLKNVFLIFNGKIKIYKTDLNGKEQIVAVLKKGEMFPHIGFFRKGGYPAFAEVQEDAVLVKIPTKKFEEVLMGNPKLCMKVFKVLGEKVVDLQDRLGEQILNNTYEQLIKLLFRLSKTYGRKLENGSVLLTENFTNIELANMIGTSRETVSRTLSKWKKERIICIHEGKMMIDTEQLLDKLF